MASCHQRTRPNDRGHKPLTVRERKAPMSDRKPILGMEPSERRALEIMRLATEQSDEIAGLQRALDSMTERCRVAELKVVAAEMARTRLNDFADKANAGQVHHDARELRRRVWASFSDFDAANHQQRSGLPPLGPDHSPELIASLQERSLAPQSQEREDQQSEEPGK